MPPLDVQNANRVDDIGVDLQRIAGGSEESKYELAEDLLVAADVDSEGRAVVTGFAARLADAVAAAELNDDGAEGVARLAWTLVAATELSDRQVKQLQEDFRAALVTAGVAPDRADALVAELPTVQRTVSTRPRRWYEVF